ncbi:MAG: hypothetical protein L0Y72_31790 [Gemmataceae bacterium]|nr:hypothetical protein [Gemmataceae bacterium]MCI0743636.1 hypothetical protein [Gemmataceae bacterium]
MPPTPLVQCNPYKGMNSRCWLRLRFAAIDGSIHERDLVADTGCPCAVILGEADLFLLMRASAAAVNSNFGQLISGWLELSMPELGWNQQLVGYGSDSVQKAVQLDSPNFTGLVGLPLLRMAEYGGDNNSFWVCKALGIP